MKKIEIIEPREIEMLEKQAEDDDPDYIPVYMEIKEKQPKYANLVP